MHEKEEVAMSSQGSKEPGAVKVIYCRDPRAAALAEAGRIKNTLRLRCTVSGVEALGRKEFKATGEGLPTVTFRQEQGGVA
jgi:hypothetical protein